MIHNLRLKQGNLIIRKKGPTLMTIELLQRDFIKYNILLFLLVS